MFFECRNDLCLPIRYENSNTMLFAVWQMILGKRDGQRRYTQQLPLFQKKKGNEQKILRTNDSKGGSRKHLI